MTCLDCGYAEWKRTSSGRLHPSKDGMCRWTMPEIDIPKARYWIGYRYSNPQPSGGHIDRGHPYDDCPCWKPLG